MTHIRCGGSILTWILKGYLLRIVGDLLRVVGELFGLVGDLLRMVEDIQNTADIN
jgi:hypothetical protein